MVRYFKDIIILFLPSAFCRFATFRQNLPNLYLKEANTMHRRVCVIYIYLSRICSCFIILTVLQNGIFVMRVGGVNRLT